MSTPKLLLTVEQAAAELQISKDALRRRIVAGDVQYVNVGTDLRPRIRVTPAALDAYIAKQTSGRPARTAS